MNDDIDAKYTAICSAQTIYSDDKGFFGELFDSVKAECTDQWIEQMFSSSMNDIDKLKVLYNEPNVSDVLLGTLEHVAPIFTKKDEPFSRQRCKASEQLMATKDFDKAVLVLSQAVLRAPHKGSVDPVNGIIDDGRTLAQALWSRSMVFLELGDGQSALADMQCAVEMGMQQAKQQSGYYCRQAKAHALIGDRNKVNICLKLAEKFTSNVRHVEELRLELNEVLATRCATTTTTQRSATVPQLTAAENPTLKNASTLIEMKTSRESGNYIVAKEPIRAGDTIIVEKPLAACLRSKYNATHCLHCCKRLVTSYACPTCCNVAFCSVACQKEACATYHQFECKFVDLLIGSGMSILCYIALRIITQHDKPADAIADGRRIVREMCANSTKRMPNDFLQRAVMSAFLLRILQKANYFGARTSLSAYPNSDAEFAIVEILFGLLQLLQFNAHEIHEYVPSAKHRLDNGKHIYIAVGLYRSAAYFNHNCYPAVVRYFVGTSIVLCTSHPIDVGDVVAENYGPNFLRQPLAERKRNLRSRYWFLCDCVSCNENWPTLSKLNNFARLKCPTADCTAVHDHPRKATKVFTCRQCKRAVNLTLSLATLKRAEDIYAEAAAAMEKENADEAINTFTSGINLFYTVAVPPHRDTHIAQESLRICLQANHSIIQK